MVYEALMAETAYMDSQEASTVDTIFRTSKPKMFVFQTEFTTLYSTV